MPFVGIQQSDATRFDQIGSLALQMLAPALVHFHGRLENPLLLAELAPLLLQSLIFLLQPLVRRGKVPDLRLQAADEFLVSLQLLVQAQVIRLQPKNGTKEQEN
jgi:hypothetical protein